MGVREALLAFLADGEKYGYQLKSEFEAATGEAWNLNVGQVYTTLQRLERDGAIVALDEDEQGRQRYRSTEAGSDELIAWFDAAVERNVAARDELSMKVLVAVATSTTDPSVVLDVQRSATMTALQDAVALRRHSGDDLIWQLHLDRLILGAEAELRWLDLAAERLRVTPPATSTDTEQPPTPGQATAETGSSSETNMVER